MPKFGPVSVLLTTAILLLQSCGASNYMGPKPNFGLRGEEAEKEIQKFTLDTFSLNQGKGFVMGEPGILRSQNSLLPIIQEVSPSAAQKIHTADNWKFVSQLFLAVGIGGLIVLLASSNQETKDRASTISLIGSGSSIATSLFIVGGLHSSAASEFNRELRKKFAPSVAYGWEF